MANSLTSGLKLGTANVSSLLKSAATVQREISTFNDTVQAQDYATSAHTDDALNTYQTYLAGRIKALQATGSITDATKAVELQNTLRGAINANITASIQRENIQVMAGNASDQDKLNLIEQQFTRAVSIGDLTTAQQLESQAYSLSQSIQLKAQQAAQARDTLAKSSASSGASSQNNVATQIETAFKQLNSDAAAAGPSKLNATLKTWVQNNKDSLLALADGPGINADTKAAIEKAVNTSQPNYQDLAMGVGQAMIAAHYQAYVAELPHNPETAQGYLNAATDLANGSTKLNTLGGSLSLQDIQNWQANPAMFAPHENADSGTLSFSYNASTKLNGSTTIAGYKFNANGQVVANFTGSDFGQGMNKQQASQITDALNKLGFNFDKQTVSTTNTLTNGITVQATNKLPKFLQPILAGQQNAQLQAYVTPQGIQLATLDANGKGHIYLVATDTKGLHAVYEATSQDANGNPIFGKQTAPGQYGFNQSNNSLFKTATQNPKTSNGTNGGLNDLNAVHQNTLQFLGRGSLDNMMLNAQQTAQRITLQRQAAEAALKASQPVQLSLPAIKSAPIASVPAPRPAPVLQPAVSPQPTTYNPQPKTVNPQPAAPSPQPTTYNPQQSGGHVVATFSGGGSLQGIPL